MSKVPAGWSEVQASDVCSSISVGVVIKPSQYYVSANEGVKAFRSANVREGFINDSDWVYFSKQGHTVNKKSQLLEGDVLIVRTGYPGTACVVTKEFEGSNAIDIVIARPHKDKILPAYLCAYTNSSIGKEQVLNLQGGMAQKHLNVGAYQTLIIRLPSINEQTKIAQILSTWDKAIATTEKLIGNSQHQKKALMQSLLTGAIKFQGFSQWKKDTLENIVGEIHGGGTPSREIIKYWSGDIPWVTVKDLIGNKIISAKEFISKSGLDNSSARLVPAGTVILCTRMAVGKAVIAECEVAINQDLKAIYPSENIISDYLHNWFIYRKEVIGKMGTGSTVKGVQISAIKSLIMSVPSSLKEQQKIAAILTAADNEIDLLQKKLAFLKQEKAALMQQLLTGKRRVKVEAA